MKALILALTTAGLMTACASSPTVKKETTMTQAERPVLTAPEVLTKALDFIRTAESPEDFRIARAEDIMKIRFIADEEAKDPQGNFYTGNDFKGTDWNWEISFVTDRVIYMHLKIKNEDSKNPATPVCQLDLDRFHPMLEQAGFVYMGKGHRGRPFNGYEKDYPNGYHGSVKVFYRGESAEKIHHDCINEITFYISKTGV